MVVPQILARIPEVLNISDAERQHHVWISDSFNQQIAWSTWTLSPNIRSTSSTAQKTSTIKIRKWSAVAQQRQVVYVGTILTDAADNTRNIQNHLALALQYKINTIFRGNYESLILYSIVNVNL